MLRIRKENLKLYNSKRKTYQKETKVKLKKKIKKDGLRQLNNRNGNTVTKEYSLVLSFNKQSSSRQTDTKRYDIPFSFVVQKHEASNE